MKGQMKDEELLQHVRNLTRELNRLPKKEDTPLAFLLKSRFGPWPRVLEKAGVKEVSEKRKEKIAERKKKRKTQQALKKAEIKNINCIGEQQDI